MQNNTVISERKSQQNVKITRKKQSKLSFPVIVVLLLWFWWKKRLLHTDAISICNNSLGNHVFLLSMSNHSPWLPPEKVFNPDEWKEKHRGVLQTFYYYQSVKFLSEKNSVIHVFESALTAPSLFVSLFIIKFSFFHRVAQGYVHRMVWLLCEGCWLLGTCWDNLAGSDEIWLDKTFH